MKKISMFLILALIVVSGGCNNAFTVKTKINADGSIEKTIVCDGDSLGIYKLGLPFTFQNGWKIDRVKKTDKTGNFITTAVKTYNNMDDLQAELAAGRDSAKLVLRSRIEKHFRWFFTYYTYEESIPAMGRFAQAVPFTTAFTPEEADRLRSGKDSVLNERFDAYWTRNIFNAVMDTIIAAAQRYNDPAFAPSRWQEARTMIVDSMEASHMWKPADIAAFFGRTLHTGAALKLEAEIDASMKKVTEMALAENEMTSPFDNEVAMPGMLLTSNSQKVEGNTVKWTCRPHQCIDVVMTAESRVINLWAFTGTGFVCFFLLAILLVPMLRRKRVA